MMNQSFIFFFILSDQNSHELFTCFIFQEEITQKQHINTRVPTYPYDCSEIKRKNPYARSGTYKISVTGKGAALFSVYCDMSGQIGWTKVLQILQPYTLTRNAFGDVSQSAVTASGKLSDAIINALAGNLRHAYGKVYYRVTASGTSDHVYTENPKAFDDTKVAWNLFNGVRSQCFGPGLDNCNWFPTDHHTLDTLHDGSDSGEARRFFTEHVGATNPNVRCYNPRSTQRCISRGADCGYCLRPNVELWVGY